MFCHFRCVMMIGMPYPNIKSPELKEKMDYLNANFVSKGLCALEGLFSLMWGQKIKVAFHQISFESIKKYGNQEVWLIAVRKT